MKIFFTQLPYNHKLFILIIASFLIFLPYNSFAQVDNISPSIILSNITISTIAGSSFGDVVGNSLDSKFNFSTSIALGPNNVIYIVDSGNNKIKTLINDTVYEFVGSTLGNSDGNGTSAQFYRPNDIVFVANGSFFYVADSFNHLIRKVNIDGTVITFAGSGIPGSLDGNGTSAEFNRPYNLALDQNDTLYVSDSLNHIIRKITLDGNVTIFAGTGTSGSIDGSRLNATFDDPRKLVFDSNNNLYVADDNADVIRKIDVNGLVTTFAGNGSAGTINGPRLNATFKGIRGLTIDSFDNIYVAEYNNHRIRVISDGIVSTLAGSDSGYVDGLASVAKFNRPQSLVIDSNVLYIADTLNHRIRKGILNPTVILDLNTNILGIQFNEQITNVDLSKFTLQNINQTLVGATSQSIDTILYIALTESQKISLVNQNKTTLDLSAGAVQDMAGNQISAKSNIQITIIPDTTSPRITNATLNLGNGTMELTFDETINLLINTSKLNFNNQVSLTDSTQSIDSNKIIIQLSESKRQDVLGLSNRQLNIQVGFVNDTFNNEIQPSIVTPITQADIIPPTFVNASINKSTGTLSILFNEKLSIIDKSQIFLSLPNMVNQHSLQNSLHTISNGMITLVLSESIRQASISDTLQLDLSLGAVSDVSSEDILEISDRIISQINDTKPPVFNFGSINASDGVIILQFNEYVKNSDLTKFTIVSNSSSISIIGAQNIISNSTLTITLTESQRQSLLEHGSSPKLTITNGAILDTSNNPISAINVSLQYISDIIPPKLIDAILDRDTRNLTLTFSESIVNPNISNIYIKEFASSNRSQLTSSVTIVGATLMLTIPKLIIDSFTTSIIQLDLVSSAVTDKAGIVILNITNFDVDIINDNFAPNFSSATFNASNGTLTVSFTKLLNTTISEPFNYTKLTLHDLNSSALTLGIINYTINNQHIQIHFDELQRQSLLSLDELQLDLDVGVIYDSNGTPNNQSTSNYLIDIIPDSIPPSVRNVTLNLDNGNLTISFNEIIHSQMINTSMINVQSFNLSGFGTSSINSSIISFTLTESQRQSVINFSTPKLNVEYAAINDTSGNPISASSVLIFITPDNLPPTIHHTGILTTDSRVSTILSANSVGSITNTTNSSLAVPYDVEFDSMGNLYIADSGNQRILLLYTNGTAHTIAGNGSRGSNDGPALSATFSFPSGIALDSVGNLYIADSGNNKIRILYKNYTVQTIAGTGAIGSADGNASSATFSSPQDVALHSNGNLYILDHFNNKIRLLDSSGLVSTIAGSGDPGHQDGNASTARFTSLRRIAFDSNDNLFITSDASFIRVLYQNGTIDTIGKANSLGSIYGSESLIAFNVPSGIAFDSSNNIFIVNKGNGTIQILYTNGTVKTIAGSGSVGSIDTFAPFATFNQPHDVALDSLGNIYIADSNSHAIRKISTISENILLNKGTGVLEIIFSERINISSVNLSRIFLSEIDSIDDISLKDSLLNTTQNDNRIILTLSESQRQMVLDFEIPQLDVSSMAVSDLHGNYMNKTQNLYILLEQDKIPPIAIYADLDVTTGVLNITFNEIVDISSISLSSLKINDIKLSNSRIIFSVNSTFAGINLTSTQLDLILQYSQLILNISDNFITDTSFNPILLQTINLTTVNRNQPLIFIDSVFDTNTNVFDITFNKILSTTINTSNILIHDITSQNRIILDNFLSVTTSGNVLSFTLTELQKYQIISLLSLQLDIYSGAVSDTNGNTITNSYNNHVSIILDTILPSLVAVQSLSSHSVVSTVAGTGSFGGTNGPALSSSFYTIQGLEFHPNGDLYIADISEIRRLSTSNIVSTVSSSVFNIPAGIEFDVAGNLYIADSANHYIKVLRTDGNVYTVSGTGVAGNTDGTALNAQFNSPYGLAFDSAGNLYIADADNNKIRVLYVNSTVATIAGDGSLGSTDGPALNASFKGPRSLTFNSIGELYIADTNNRKIRVLYPNGTVSTVAGNGTSGSVDGLAQSSTFSSPFDLEFDTLGNLYIADFVKIRVLYKNGTVSTAAGNGSSGNVNSLALNSTFAQIYTIEFDSIGNLYVGTNDKYIRKISATTSNIFDANTGRINLLFSEIIDVSNIDLSDTILFNTVSGNNISLKESKIDTILDNATIKIILTESQRYETIGNDLRLLVNTSAFKDISGNSINTMITNLTTISDTTSPSFISASLEQSTGILKIQFDDIINTSSILLSDIYIQQNDSSNKISLSGSSIISSLNSSVIIQLDYAHRYFLINNTKPNLEILEDSIKDVFGNGIKSSLNNITYITLPVTIFSTNQLGDMIIITFNDTFTGIDNTPSEFILSGTNSFVNQISISNNSISLILNMTIIYKQNITLSLINDEGVFIDQNGNILSDFVKLPFTNNVLPLPPLLTMAFTDLSGHTISLVFDETIFLDNLTLFNNFILSGTNSIVSNISKSNLSTITLTLSEPVLANQTIRLDYNRTQGGIFNLNNAFAKNITSQNITNNIQMSAPTISSSETNTAGSNISIMFNKDIILLSTQNTLDFTLSGTSATVSNITLKNNTSITLFLSGSILANQTITLSYNRTADGITDTNGTALENFTGQSITNIIPKTAPTISIASTNTAGSIILITFDEDIILLSNTPVSNFVLSGTFATISSLSTQNNTAIILVLSGSILANETISLDYTRTTGGITDTNGTILVDFTNISILNTITKQALTAIAASTNTMGNTITITFDKSIVLLSTTNTSDFTVYGTPAIVSSIILKNNTSITLSLNDSITTNQTLSLSYNRTIGGITDANGTILSNITSLDVQNLVPMTPSMISEAYTNTQGNTITIIFDEDIILSSTTPASDFIIFGTSATVSNLTLQNNTSITLSLSGSILANQTITLSYNNTAGGITDSEGTVLENFTGQSIANTIPKTVPSISVASTNIAGNTITIIFDENIILLSNTNILDFIIFGTSATVSNLTLQNNTSIILSLNDSILANQTITLSYNRTIGGITDTNGTALENFTGQSIANIIPKTAPTISTASTNIQGNTITIIFDENIILSSTTPTSDFILSGTFAIISSTSTQNNTAITLALSGSILANQTITLSYTKTTGGITDTNGTALENLTGQSISNTIPKIAPTVSTVTTNTAGNTIIIIFNKDIILLSNTNTLDFILFGTSVTVSNITTHNSTSIILSLNDSITTNQTLSLSYNRTIGGITDANGTILSNITSLDVQNLVPMTPSMISEAYTNTQGNTITITFDEDIILSSSTPTSDFTLSGTSATISSISTQNNTAITLALSSSILANQTITLSYTKTRGGITDSEGTALENFIGQSITNTIPKIAPSVSTVSTNTVGNTIIIIFNKDIILSNTNILDFTLSGTSATISSISTQNNTAITLALSGSILANQTITLSYNRTIGGITDTNGTALENFTGQSIANTIPKTAPTVSTAFINTLGTVITITFNEDILLSSTTPTSDFTLSGTSATISSISTQNNTAITLSLSSSVLANETISIDYTRTVGGLTDTNGTFLSNIVSQNIQNLVPMTPSMISTIYTNTQGNTVTITFDEDIILSSLTPVSDFIISGTSATVSNIIKQNNTSITLSLSGPILANQTITLSYNRTIGGITDTNGTALENFTGQSIVNIIPKTAPTISIASTNTAGSIILITFDEDIILLSNTPVSNFVLSGTSATVSNIITQNNTSITLSLSGSILANQTITLNYTKTTGGITDTNGTALEDFTGQSIANTIPKTAPTVSTASTNTAGSTITITFDKDIILLSTTITSDFVLSGTSATISSISTQNNNAITLVLSDSILANQTITLSYNNTTGGITDTNGTALENFTGQNIANIIPKIAPTVSIISTNTVGTIITITFDKNIILSPSTPTSDFTPSDTSVTISNISVQNNTTIILTLSDIILATQLLTLSYTLTSGGLFDQNGTALENFTNQNVVNNVRFDVISASLNKGTGILVINFTSTLDLTPTSLVDQTRIFISETGSSNQISLVGSIINSSLDSTVITFTLTEEQRQRVILLTTPQLDILSNALQDTSNNLISTSVDNTITTTLDLIPPLLSSIVLDKGRGLLAILFNEKIDLTPTSQVDLSKLFINELNNSSKIPLAGSTITNSIDNNTILITLTDSQRENISALATLQLSIETNALRDISNTSIQESINNSIYAFRNITLVSNGTILPFDNTSFTQIQIPFKIQNISINFTNNVMNLSNVFLGLGFIVTIEGGLNYILPSNVTFVVENDTYIQHNNWNLIYKLLNPSIIQIPDQSNFNNTSIIAVSLGSDTNQLVFTKPVKIIFHNQGGNGYTVYSQINNQTTYIGGVCDSANNISMIKDQLENIGQCMIDQGENSDVIIWTNHTTDFGLVHTQYIPPPKIIPNIVLALPTSASGGGGGGGTLKTNSSVPLIKLYKIQWDTIDNNKQIDIITDSSSAFFITIRSSQGILSTTSTLLLDKATHSTTVDSSEEYITIKMGTILNNVVNAKHKLVDISKSSGEIIYDSSFSDLSEGTVPKTKNNISSVETDTSTKIKSSEIKNIPLSSDDKQNTTKPIVNQAQSQQTSESNILDQTPTSESNDKTQSQNNTFAPDIFVDDKPTGGCLIATATFGTELHSHIQILREIRHTMIDTNHGSEFIETFNQIYYTFSPFVSDLQRTNPLIKDTMHILLYPLLSSISILALSDSNDSMIILGSIIILINIIVYILIPTLCLIKFKHILSASMMKNKIET